MAMTREVGLGVKRFGASKSQLAKLSTSALAGNHTIADSSSYRKGDLEAWPATGKRKQQGEKTTMSISTGGGTAAVATVHLPSPVQPTCGSTVGLQKTYPFFAIGPSFRFTTLELLATPLPRLPPA